MRGVTKLLPLAVAGAVFLFACAHSEPVSDGKPDGKTVRLTVPYIQGG